MKKTQGSIVSFRRPDGGELQGYLAKPEKTAGAPAVVVVQEWWGLNDQIRGVADRLAEAGYFALVPDLYRGKSTVEEEEANHLMSELDFGDAATQDVHGAVKYLKQQSSRVAVLGYCMGGALALLTTANVPEVSAAVTFYGFPPLEYIDPSAIKVPVLGHWATQDAFFPIETVETLENKLRDAGVSVEFHRYLAYHGFTNETAVGYGRISRTQYDSKWAEMAWDRTFSFLGRTMWDALPGKK
jgi:carboxymethylenebutenolidase